MKIPVAIIITLFVLNLSVLNSAAQVPETCASTDDTETIFILIDSFCKDSSGNYEEPTEDENGNLTCPAGYSLETAKDQTEACAAAEGLATPEPCAGDCAEEDEDCKDLGLVTIDRKITFTKCTVTVRRVCACREPDSSES